jgi:hypothetical protein
MPLSRKCVSGWLSFGLLGVSHVAFAQSVVGAEPQAEPAAPPPNPSAVTSAPQPSEARTLPAGLSRSWDDPDPGPTPEPSVEPEHRSVAPAARREAGYRDHPFHFELIFGGDTRVGELGMAFEYALGDALSLGVGVGSNGYGAEWAANARLRPIWWRTPTGSFFQALTLEGSVSRATQTSGEVNLGPGCEEECTDTNVVPQTVYWSQAELGWEGMIRNGFSFRASSGIANAIGSRVWRCESPTAAYCNVPARQYFVQTFALGVAF